MLRHSYDGFQIVYQGYFFTGVG